MSRGALLGLALAACGGSSTAPNAPGPAPAPVAAPAATCERSAARTLELRGDVLFTELPADKRALWQGRYTEMLVTACREDAWPQAVIECGAAAADVPALEACPDPDRAALEKLGARVQPFLEAMIEDVKRSQPPTVPLGDPSLAAWTSGETAIAACDGYVFAIEAFIACDRTPPSSDEMGRKTVATMKEDWRRFRDPSVPAAERQDAADTCHAGTQDVRAAALAAGCPIPQAPPPAVVPPPAKPTRTK